jgi:hypothetical protein
MRRVAFQKFITFAVLLPESFRGGCSFGADKSISPAKDLVLAIVARLAADGMLRCILERGFPESNAV